MEVPLLDLKTQYKQIKKEINLALKEVLNSQRFILGKQVETLEQKIAAYCGVRYAIGVSSGTDALLLSLMAYEIGALDEVITTPYTFFATAGSIARLGAKPVFVDIDPLTYNIDVSKIKAVITSKTKAIVPVCLFGQGVDISPLLTIAKEYNLVVIEDAAQALGARYKEKKVGSMGQAGCFSFFPTKNLGGYGDGGMVVTNDGDIYKKIKTLRVHGAEGKFLYGLIGGNFRLDEIQAAVLLVKLAYLDEWNKKRVAKAKNYFNLFKKANLLDKITPPFVALYNSHIFHQYVISALKRDALFNYLKKCGIGCAIYYPIPLHLQPCLCFLGYKKGDFPQAEKAAKKTLALPMYPELTTAQQEYVTNCIKKFYKNL